MKRLPQLMGILNVTPDSFSDGGKFVSVEAAVAHARQMLADGAAWIDVGGESTRPGAESVQAGEELNRVVPVIEWLASKGAQISIDTTKPEVARSAIAAGASMVNDVSGLRDPDMIDVVAESGVGVCIMHMQGDPRSMQENPTYADVVEDVRRYLLEQAEKAASKGINEDRIWIDPGIGFGKTIEHNLKLIKHLDRFVDTGLKVLLGVSRKSFIGRVLATEGGSLPVEERLEGTLAVQVWAAERGVDLLRVHDVRPMARILKMLEAIDSA